jgi:predicted double-glycine peptidase
VNIRNIYKDNNLAIQSTSYTCGPASLLNVLNLKGEHQITEKYLTRVCGSTPQTGTSNEGLVNGARKASLEVIEVKDDADLGDIERNLDNGNFIIVNYLNAFSGNGHYSLVSEIDDEALYLKDCALGLLRLRKDLFEKHWHNGDKSIYRWYIALK